MTEHAASDRPASAGMFLDGSPTAIAAYKEAVALAAELVTDMLGSDRPTSGARFDELASRVRDLEVLPEEGVGTAEALRQVARLALGESVAVAHPAYLAHLHCPPLVASLGAEVLVSAANQSLDSFDQGPSAAAIETHVIRCLLDLAGLGDAGDGVFTSGATQSNLMGILMARDRYASRCGQNARADGVPSSTRRWRILCSELSHFSVAQAAAVCGLGERAILTVPANAAGEMTAGALASAIEEARARDEQPIAVVATAGTTDLGSIDPIDALLPVARRHDLWFHLDAAMGGALLLTERYRAAFTGIDQCDSIALDCHKLLFQPISCGVFLVRDATSFEALRHHAPYLNPDDDALGRRQNLVWKSLQTTRRFDALKVLVSLRALGRRALATVLDELLDLTQATARAALRSEHLKVVVWPRTMTLLLRWDPTGLAATSDQLDAINRAIPDRLWDSRRAVIGRTTYRGDTALRLTVLTPTSESQMRDVLAAISNSGCELYDEQNADRTARGPADGPSQ